MAERSVNKVILLGRLGKDAETRFTPSGMAVSSFSVATNRRSKDGQSGEWKEETDWHNVVVFDGERVSQYLLKGKQVYLEGRIQTRSYEKEGQKQYRTEIVCNAADILLLGGRGDEGGPGMAEDRAPQPVSRPRTAAPAGRPPAKPEPDFDPGINDDDVPF